MNKKQVTILLAIIVLLSVTASIMYYSFFKVVKVEQTNYYFSVQNHLGFVGDTDALKFGGVMREGTGKRKVSFRNEFDFPVKVSITISGEKSEWITIIENEFILEEREAKVVAFVVSVPKGASFNNYSGIVTAKHIRYG